MKTPFRQVLLAGLTAGVLAGSVAGAGFVIANRYLSAGYPQLALDSLCSWLNRGTVVTGLVFVQIELTGLLLAAVLGRKARTAYGPNSVLWVILATGCALWYLGRAPWVPEVRTGRGFFPLRRRGARQRLFPLLPRGPLPDLLPLRPPL